MGKKFSKEESLKYAKKKEYLSKKIYFDYIYIYFLLTVFLLSSMWLTKMLLEVDDFRSGIYLLFLAIIFFSGLLAILRLFSIVIKLKK